MSRLHLGFWDYIKIGLILGTSVFVIWIFMIRPHSFDWQPGGEIQAQVKSLMSNTNVVGSPSVKAVVTLPSGRQVIVDVPTHSHVRAGSPIYLSVQVDGNNPDRKRYFYKSD